MKDLESERYKLLNEKAKIWKRAKEQETSSTEQKGVNFVKKQNTSSDIVLNYFVNSQEKIDEQHINLVILRTNNLHYCSIFSLKLANVILIYLSKQTATV